MQFLAKVVEDSRADHGGRLTTLQLKYPRFIHAEFMTHRMFSRNASSSRAIPVAKILEQVRTDPAMPCHWGANQPGMQAAGEVDEQTKALAKQGWVHAANWAADYAEGLANLGLHKQVCNRLLEPFQFMHVVVTATEWDNFFALRDHEAAEPNIQVLARCMRHAMGASEPVLRPRRRYEAEAWHLPYITEEERQAFPEEPHLLAKLSAARCARVSYMNHDGTSPDTDKDLELYKRLVGSTPMHASPVEHQAYSLVAAREQSNNFRGWRQYRELVEVGRVA